METTQLFSKEENVSFWKNLLLIVVFFTITPITLGISLFSLISLKTSDIAKTQLNTSNLMSGNLINEPQSGVRVYASLPNKFPSINGSVEASDARPEIIKEYLTRYNSPLIPY